MTGLTVFAAKEAWEILRTWRIWVLPGIVLFFAVSGPPLAWFTPQITQAAVGSQLHGLKLPTPTYTDSYAQWLKNLSQLVVVALIIVYGGIVSGEVRSGTAALVLSKPLPRLAFVAAKALVHSAFLALMVTAGTLITWGLTAVIFNSAPGGPLWSGTLEWLVLGTLFVALMTMLSVLIGSTAGAAGAGIAVYVLLSIATIWQPLKTYSPAALVTQPAALAAGQRVSAGWPVATSIALAFVLLALAYLRLRTKDL